jgi:hypothetical protein
MAGTPEIARKNGKKGGRPKGKKSQATLEKEKVLAEMKQRIMRISQRLLDAQLTRAIGMTFLYKIEKEKIVGPKGGISYRNKPPVRVTSEEEIRDYLDNKAAKANGDLEDDKDRSATYYYMTTSEPDTHAIDSMYNRTYGKPTQSVEISGPNGAALFSDDTKRKSKSAVAQAIARHPRTG